MNKEQIEEIALRVAHDFDIDAMGKENITRYATDLIAELANEQEPFAYVRADGIELLNYNVDLPDKTPLYTHSFPQADLVAEIEALRSELAVSDRRGDCFKDDSIKLRQQLSAAQASESELLKALEWCKCITDWTEMHRHINEAIAAHKARNERK